MVINHQTERGYLYSTSCSTSSESKWSHLVNNSLLGLAALFFLLCDLNFSLEVAYFFCRMTCGSVESRSSAVMMDKNGGECLQVLIIISQHLMINLIG